MVIGLSMKLSIIGILLTLVSSAVFAGLLSEKPVTWQPIVGQPKSTAKSFFDRNSLKTTTTEAGKVSFGNILIVLDKSEPGTVNGKPIQIRSLVRITMMNCGSGMTIPVADIFFNNTYPTNETDPVKISLYDGITGTTITDRKSILYGLLCPDYI